MEEFINFLIELMDRVDLKEVILGAFFGWLVTFIYFRVSIRDFFAQRQLRLLAFLGLEKAGYVRYLRDEEGHMAGLLVDFGDDIVEPSSIHRNR